jgi:alpha/beta superfamily hydrolase
MSDSRQENGYFQSGSAWLYGACHLPAGSVPSAGVLLCPPFGEERKSTLRPLVGLAGALASAGLAVCRFDYSGTGDSSGDPSAATWAGWADDAAAALGHGVKSLGIPAERWSLLAVRHGAIAAVEVARRQPVRRLVLIEPVLSGVTAWRDLELRRQIQSALGVQAGEDAAGVIDLGGHPVNAVWRSGLQGFLLTEALAAVACPAEVLHVSGARTLTGDWSALETVVKPHGGRVRLLAERPFWGLGDAAEIPSLNRAVLESLESGETLS